MFSPTIKKPLTALAAVISLLSADYAIAASTRFDCKLTEVETKVGANTDFKAESRVISVIVDAGAKMITVDQDSIEQRLQHVTATQTALNGYNDELSLGIDASSGGVVLQTYKPASMDLNQSPFVESTSNTIPTVAPASNPSASQTRNEHELAPNLGPSGAGKFPLH